MGELPDRLDNVDRASGDLIIIGVLGHSAVIDGLVSAGKIAASDIAGQWEAYRQVVVDRPFPKVAARAGDRRARTGAARCSAPTMCRRRSASRRGTGSPMCRCGGSKTCSSRRDRVAISRKVRYRGFFINDEDPAFSGWARKQFGGVNAAAYEHVFELLLRLKGNYLWPAMWARRAFNDDDPQNMVLADAMGVVMGTSHHEPMTRAHDEWHRTRSRRHRRRVGLLDQRGQPAQVLARRHRADDVQR